MDKMVKKRVEKLTKAQAKALLKKYAPSEKDFRGVFAHTDAVRKLAHEMGAKIKKNGHEIDLDFIDSASILHDIGRFECPPGTKMSLQHGILGAKILIKEGLPRHADATERHIGVGISKKDIIKKRLPLPKRDLIPKSIEEYVIAFADNLIWGSKRMSLKWMLERTERELGWSEVDDVKRVHNMITKMMSPKKELILAINPGSTSTKIAVFDDRKRLFQRNIEHSSKDIKKYKNIMEQLDFRKDMILSILEKEGYHTYDMKAIVGRGGLLRPIEGGVYNINSKMLKDLSSGKYGEHASNLGAHLATALGDEEIPCFIVDPPVVDEMQDLARLSGHPSIQRRSIFHALNQKSVASEVAKKMDKKYSELNMIVAHLGGGISVGAHRKGKVIDVNNALDGDGPFSPERSGELFVFEMAGLIFSGKYSQTDIKKMITGRGGLVSYFNTSDVLKIMGMKSKKAKVVMDAFIFQIAREIGRCAAVLKGKVDCIILTGGIAFNKTITSLIRERVGSIAPVKIYAGEDEMKALAYQVSDAIQSKKFKDY